MEIQIKDTILRLKDSNYEIEKEGMTWKIDPSFSAKIVLKNDRYVLFKDAKQQDSSYYETSVAKGILTSYRDIKGVNFAFDVLVWIEISTQDVFFEWIPINDNGFDIKEIDFPGNLLLEKANTYVPYKQGICIPNEDLKSYTLSNYVYDLSMPWIGQIQDQYGYIMINETLWDAKYIIEKQKDNTSVRMTHIPSLGKMNYKRIIRYSFIKECTYIDLCDIYKNYLKEKGKYQEIKDILEIKNTQSICFQSKDKELMIQNEDGSYHKEDSVCHSFWKTILKNKVKDVVDCIYIDNFNRIEECNNPKHRMSRKECMELKSLCILYLKNKGITPILVNLNSYYMGMIIDIDKYMEESKEDFNCIGIQLNLFDQVHKEGYKFISKGLIIDPNKVILNYTEGKYTLK